MAGLAIGEGVAPQQFLPGRSALDALKERFAEGGETPEAGGDEVALSPRALTQGLEGSEDDGDKSGSGEVEESGGPLVRGLANGLIHKALNGIKRDLGQILKGFGFAAEAANSFAKSFVEPVLEALKEGVSFSAELSYAAFAQTTEVSGQSFSQSTALVAKSLSIEVNQATGEVAVSLASLSFQQEVRAVASDGPVPLLQLGPGPIAPPPEPILLPPEKAESAELAEEAEELEEGEETAPEDPLTDLLRDLQTRLSFEAVTFQAAIAIRSIEFYENEAGDPIARIEADAAVPLDQAAAGLPDEDEVSALDVTA